MKSIQTKIIVLITSAVLTLSLLVGGFSVLNTSQLVENDSKMMMNSVCKEQSMKLDNQLELVEQAVGIIYNYAETELRAPEALTDKKYKIEYTTKVQEMALNVSNDTEGALSVYYRYNPELVDSTSGFFWSRKENDGPLLQETVTDLSLYDSTDKEHVGWYYQPIDAGTAIWMQPYHNDNLDIEMISYVIPLYKDDVLVGVIGMDIDFNLFVDIAQGASVYEDSSVYLVDMDNKRAFFRDRNDDKSVHYCDIKEAVYNDLLDVDNSDDSLKEYTNEANAAKMAFQTIRNNMKFLVCVPTKKINEKRVHLMLAIIIMTLAIQLLYLTFTIYMAKRIIKPLKVLTETTERIAKGNLDVSVEIDTNDEIATLSQSIQTMASELKSYVAQIHDKAYMDEPTGLYNRRSYEDDMMTYPDVPPEEDFVYASIDVNGLKTVNDTLGHAAGDELIVGAASVLKQTVGNYGKVYRVGGDEFVSMFFADEEHLDAVIEDLAAITAKWKGQLVDTLSLSVGYATKRELKTQTVKEMSAVADQRMYDDKARYYSQKGIDRRGQASAHKALCELYTKILKINITDDTYSIINMDISEQTQAKGFANKISAWLQGFGRSGQVHQEDLEHYLKEVDLEYLRQYFKEDKTSISIHYRRKYGDEYKQVVMEMIPADDYTHDNQTLFLYVKSIDK